MMKSFFLMTVLLLVQEYSLCGSGRFLTVVPQPMEVRFTEQAFSLKGGPVEIRFYGNENGPVRLAVEELRGEFERFRSGRPRGPARAVRAGVPAEDREFKKICTTHNLLPEARLGDEGYRLLIGPDLVLLSANSPRGVFYGLQTLKQIVRGTRQPLLPGVRVRDWPEFTYRAVMDDISRGPLPTMDFMKKQIRRLAELKVNTFMHYVEHVVKTTSHPAFAPRDGSVTIDEWRELATYAARYNITLVGGFQSFGHFTSVLNTPEYAHLGESGTLLSPVLPESYTFLEDIYTEMIPAFNAPFFSINCDETFDLGKGASKKLVDSIGYDGVYFQHIMKLYQIVRKLGPRVLMWGDILLEYPHLLEKLPKDIVIGTWTYDDRDAYDGFIDPIKKAGFQFLVTPGVLNSGKLFPVYKQTFGNVQGFAKAGRNAGAWGLVNTVWDDGGRAFFSNDWFGVAYGADRSWNPLHADSASFDHRFCAGIYGASGTSYTRAIWKLNELADLEPTDGMTDKILYERIVPDSGKQARISVAGWEKVGKIAEGALALLRTADLRNSAEDKVYLESICALYGMLSMGRSQLLQAARLYADAVTATSPLQARNAIIRAIGLVDSVRERESMAKSTFEKLWLHENHTYALERLSDIHRGKIADLDDVKKRLIGALAKQDSGEPFPSQEAVRLGISPLPGKYFREWLATRPMPNKDRRHLSHIDYLMDMGGEAAAVPKVTQEFYDDSLKNRWSRITSAYQDVVDLAELFPEQNRDVVLYAFATVEAGSDTGVRALLGCDDGAEVLVNGVRVFEKECPGGLTPDEFSFLLPLRKGVNHLLLKISQTEGSWGFSFRLPDSEVRSRKNRYRLVSD
jgi:hexosaminidase